MKFSLVTGGQYYEMRFEIIECFNNLPNPSLPICLAITVDSPNRISAREELEGAINTMQSVLSFSVVVVALLLLVLLVCLRD